MKDFYLKVITSYRARRYGNFDTLNSKIRPLLAILAKKTPFSVKNSGANLYEDRFGSRLPPFTTHKRQFRGYRRVLQIECRTLVATSAVFVGNRTSDARLQVWVLTGC